MNKTKFKEDKIINRIRFFHLIRFQKKGLTIQQIAISGFLLSLITISKLLDEIFPKTPLGYSWVEFYAIFTIIMILIMPFSVSVMVILAAPFLWLAIGQTTQTSPFSFFLDYSLPLLSMLIIYLAKFIKESNPKKIFTFKKLSIVFLTILAFLIKWSSHTISGAIFFSTPWSASAFLNAPMVFTTLLVTILCLSIMLLKISFLQQFANKKGINW